jgi:hypothetical protein
MTAIPCPKMGAFTLRTLMEWSLLAIPIPEQLAALVGERAFRRLPPSLRNIFLLHYVDGLDLCQIPELAVLPHAKAFEKCHDALCRFVRFLSKWAYLRNAEVMRLVKESLLPGSEWAPRWNHLSHNEREAAGSVIFLRNNEVVRIGGPNPNSRGVCTI